MIENWALTNRSKGSQGCKAKYRSDAGFGPYAFDPSAPALASRGWRTWRRCDQGFGRGRPATAETLRNGWHHTGDLFVVAENGQVKMVDRRKYLIKTGGENVYPQEVELVMLRHRAIADAAVVGIRDEKWGRR